MSKDWQIANIKDIKPAKESWSEGWHSIRKHFGIEGFGVNASTKNKGERITPEHDETSDGQQEIFVVIDGKAKFVLDGETVEADKLDIIFAEPSVKRYAEALEDGTVVLVVGGIPGKGFKVGEWEK